MRILLTNDDGIDALGLRLMAEAAKTLDAEELWIVAPDSQCSAMSQRITLRQPMRLKEVEYPVAGIQAFSLGGTPADCVKVALSHIMTEHRPDVIFSGMNFGYNSGFDIAYSGTVGAALEALLNGIPSYAFSNEAYKSNDLAVHYMPQIMKEVLSLPFDGQSLINVNFPGCPVEECAGVLWDRTIAPVQYYIDHYDETVIGENERELVASGVAPEGNGFPEGTDIAALQDNYISIGRVYSMVLKDRR